MRISGMTTVCGIVGDPVEHSLSPLMHNAAFEALGLDCVYVPFRVARDAVDAAARAVRHMGIRGLNVTVPHKVDIMNHLDWIDPFALSVGAVNTIVNDGGRLSGYNTDATGFVRGLDAFGIDVRHERVMVLGAGGAARAVVCSLLDRGARVTVLNRNAGRAAQLAEDVGIAAGRGIAHGALTDSTLDKGLAACSLLVNATSVGMYPWADESPCPRRYLRSDLVVCDIVYNPPKTQLLRDAASCGAAVITGVEMLVQQGALAFELWTGVPAPVDVMRAVVRTELEDDSE